MKYFLDSAKLEEIKIAYHTFGIDGVTTNPKHIKLSGKPFLTVLEELASWVKEERLEGYNVFPISVEVNPHLEKEDDLVKAAEEIAALSPNFVIKIPCTGEGVAAARKLEQRGIRTNLTLIFSAAQAIIGGKNQSLFISPFIGWKEDNGEDCRKYIEDIAAIFRTYGFNQETQIICAAIRTPKQIVDCALAGADIVTAGLEVYQESFRHPYTNQGIAIFTEAWDNTEQS